MRYTNQVIFNNNNDIIKMGSYPNNGKELEHLNKSLSGFDLIETNVKVYPKITNRIETTFSSQIINGQAFELYNNTKHVGRVFYYNTKK